MLTCVLTQALLGFSRMPCSQSVLEQIKSIFNGLEPLPPGKIPPTVGLNIGRVRIERSNLVFWDLGGARSLRSLWEKCATPTMALRTTAAHTAAPSPSSALFDLCAARAPSAPSAMPRA